jgi:GNAT superfamily N-acetyltransferase
MTTIQRATREDVADFLKVLNEASAWLRSRGIDQWPDGFGPERIETYVARREAWLARDAGGRPVATVIASTTADPDFWTPGEARETAIYVSKLAVTRACAGRGLGALLLRWVTDYAAQLGHRFVRLDAWRTNEALHAFYRREGWEYLRTVERPHRRSGALFQRPALPDLVAREAFTLVTDQSPWLPPGTWVDVADVGRGVVTGLSVQSELGIVPCPGDYGVISLPAYRVRLDDGREVLSRIQDVTALEEARHP